MFQKQLMMRKVLYALLPIALFSVWLYGPRVLAVLALSIGTGVLVEYLFEKKKGGKVSEAVLVTGTLLALSMPPAVPLWIVPIGAAFAVFMAKEVYGGFGKNIFNPAIAGRLFIYISFAGALGGSFYAAGNFGMTAGSLFGTPDALSAATPLALMRKGQDVDIFSLLFGVRSGTIGETSAALILAAAIYLIATKTAQWRLMLSTVLGGGILCAAFWYLGAPGALPPQSLLAGSFLFIAVFMSTDPVSAPKKKGAQWAYGILIGSCIVIIRTFSAFPEGTSFGLLLGNTFASLFDKLAADSGRRKAEKAKLAAANAMSGTAAGGSV